MSKSYQVISRNLHVPNSRDQHLTNGIDTFHHDSRVFNEIPVRISENNNNNMAAMTKFDDLFFGILQNCEQIEPFLDVVFSFLARRTDFFCLMHSKTDKMGFPPGVAEKMVLKVFRTNVLFFKKIEHQSQHQNQHQRFQY